MKKTKALDGGWAWAVVVASFFAHAIVDGMDYTLGILLRELREYFGESRQKMGMIASVSDTVAYISMAVTGVLLNKYGFRKVGIVGGVVFAGGLIVSCFSPDMNFLFFSLGTLTACGYGLIYLPAIVSVTQYFDQGRSFAVGLAVSGAGVGTFLFAPLIGFLLQEFGWRGTFLILGGIALNAVTCATIYRPLPVDENEPSAEVDSRENAENALYERDFRHECVALKESSNVRETSSENIDSDSVCKPSVIPSSPIQTFERDADEENPSRTKRFCGRVVNCLRPHLQVLSSKVALMWATAEFLTVFGVSIVFVFVPDMAVLAGFSTKQTVSLISIGGLANTISRIAFGWLAGRSFVNRPALFAVNMTILGGIVTVLPWCTTSYILLACTIALFGASYGCRVAQSPVVMTELIGRELLALGVGLAGFTGAFAGLFSATLCGTMFDKTGTYTVPFGVMGVVVIAGSTLHWAMLFTSEYRESRRRFQQKEKAAEDRVIEQT